MDVSDMAVILFVTGEDLTTDFRVHDIVAREGLSRMLLPDVCAEIELERVDCPQGVPSSITTSQMNLFP